jgi:hypothetical protein
MTSRVCVSVVRRASQLDEKNSHYNYLLGELYMETEPPNLFRAEVRHPVAFRLAKHVTTSHDNQMQANV